MSETDDTDELLLIPPDRFVPNQAPESPYFNVVDCLITQVNLLENRINLIESSSELSISLISDSSEMHSPKIKSTQSTPQKPRSKFTVQSLPNSPETKVSPQKKNFKKSEVNPMLGEIDSFLSNVKYIKRLNTVRNLETDFNRMDINTDKLNMNQVNEMLKEVELEEPCIKEKQWQAGDHVGSVPDYGYNMRRNMYQNSEILESDSSSGSQVTAFEKLSYKQKNQDSDLGMLSLANLWNSNDVSEMPSKFQQKLQEEKLRRQHCERAIQELQNRVLELQERVAVAIQVDEAKDKAIMRFHDSWEKAGTKLQDIEKQKQKLEVEVEKLRKKLNEDSDETSYKIAHYEKEASMALNMAHSTQDKLGILERKCQQLEVELKTSELNSEEFQKKYLGELEKNRQYPEILAQKEFELNDCKSVLNEARIEVAQSKKAVEICQSELQKMKSENDNLQTKLNAERENNDKITEQKNKLLEEIDAHKSVAVSLREELSKTREQMENNKLELKNFYQGQVELVVQSKLKEFQKQLDEAEKALKDELSKKELCIAKAAASHIQQISDKHSLEIKLLEEKHQEESRLYHLQIGQFRHELEDANVKIKRQHDKHLHIEKQLHKFMESLKQDHMSTLEEMNSFRSKSFNNLEEILSLSTTEEEKPTKKAVETENMGETPVSSRGEKAARRKEATLQETIQMLLDKRALGDGEGAQFYQKMIKDMKGKPPWK